MASHERTIVLDLDPPFAADALLRALRAHAIPGMERVEPDGEGFTRVVRAPGGPAIVTVWLRDQSTSVAARMLLAHGDDLDVVTAAVRGWLDLDARPAAVTSAFAGDPRLAPLVAARPGLRVLGATDGFETAVLIVLGQQVSLAAARTFGGRLLAALGDPAGDGLRAFPTAERVVDAGPDRLKAAIGVTGARARSVHGLARAVTEGLSPTPGADPEAFRERVLALPGIGPWTADCLALRVLGDRDAFPSGDLVLRRALGAPTAREAEELSASWRPWRAYAVFHLWTAAAFLT